MLTYLLRRVLAMIPTLLGITFVTFLIMTLAPGDPVSTRFQSAEGGDGEGGGQERVADAIRAKKKLLGMVREAHGLLAWSPEAGEAPDDREVPALDLDRVIEGGMGGWAKALAALPDGSVVAGGDDRVVRVIDPKSGRPLAEMPGHEQVIFAVAASADGARIVSGDGDGVVRGWGRDGSEAFTTTVASLPVRDLLVLPDGRVAVAGDDGALTLLSPQGAVAARWTDHVGPARALVASPDGATLWSAGADRKVREWDVATGTVRRIVHDGSQVNALALARDGSALYSGGDDRRAWRIPLDGGGAAELGRHAGPVTALAISRDGGALYSGGRDEIVRRWDLASGTLVAQTRQALGPAWAIVEIEGGELLTASDSWMPVPIPKRYLSWLSRLVRLDFDRSFKDDRPVMEKIAGALKVTVALNFLAILVIYAIAVPLGVAAAARRGSAFDHASSVALFILYSVPSFWLGTLLILTFSSKTAWDVLPAVGLASPDHENLSYLSWLGDRIAHLILPLIVMTYAGFAGLSRYARTSMLETIGQDFVRTARAKGLSERVVLWKHAFRNSLVTIVTLVGNLLPGMIGGSVIVESIFSINGMGKLGFESILARDYPVVMAITTFSALLTLLGILLSDILYTIVDPRITHS